MALSEADTRAKYIDPAIHSAGWTEDLIRREESAGAVEIIAGKPRRRSRGKVDYVLRVKARSKTHPVAVALIEAKKDTLPPGHGLDQAKGYAACKRLNVPFVYSSNGHLFVEFDRETGLTSPPRPMAEFPSPQALRSKYEDRMGFSLGAEEASPLLQPYASGEGTRRYYQDAAIRAAIEKTARCEIEGTPARALLSLATGAGKTFIERPGLLPVMCSPLGHGCVRPNQSRYLWRSNGDSFERTITRGESGLAWSDRSRSGQASKKTRSLATDR